MYLLAWTSTWVCHSTPPKYVDQQLQAATPIQGKRASTSFMSYMSPLLSKWPWLRFRSLREAIAICWRKLLANRYVRRHIIVQNPPCHNCTSPWCSMTSLWAPIAPCLAKFDMFTCFQAFSVFSRWHTHLTHVSNTSHVTWHHTPVKSCQARLTACLNTPLTLPPYPSPCTPNS